MENANHFFEEIILYLRTNLWH